MKSLLSVIITFAFLAQLPDPPQKQRDSTMYLAAYNYILKDTVVSKYKINVLNNLTGSMYTFFSDDLKKEGEKEIETYKRFFELDEKHSLKKPVISPYFSSWFVKHQKPTAMLSFSKVIDNSLFATLRIGDSVRVASKITWGVDYYFIFESDGTIKIKYEHQWEGL